MLEKFLGWEFPRAAREVAEVAVDRRPVTVHRTYVANGVKAPVPGVKKLLSAGVRGAAIRLFEPESELALAEGIETALAVHLRLGLPV